TRKHVSDPLKKSAAKRINMFLRWMVRSADAGVDFGIWKSISPALLSCPLDVHSGRVARQLGLLKRKQNDASALAELDRNLRKFDPKDPVKYDFALFGLSAFEKELF
ncbi:MAG: TIGR02757 family protein, partial [Leeuwenhoekiella sp.]